MTHKYIQTKEVSWLNTPEGTVWALLGIDGHIQPEDPALRETIYGVDLDLLTSEDLFLFKPFEDGGDRD
jgi:hypothetical protein